MAAITIGTTETPTALAVYKVYEKRAAEANDGERLHLGASEIGDECARKNWYSFRWALSKRFDGRMLKLFQRGHREEPVIFKDLREAGIEVHDVDANGDQYGFAMWGGHFAGHFDAVAKGYPEAPTVWHLTECKTHNDKRFNELVAKGVVAAQWKHYVQMQLYMHHSGVKRAMYFAVNKNDDSVYTERVPYDEKVALDHIAKAESVIFADSPPPRISEKPDFFKCKYCDYYSVCHEPMLPEVNCRTCAHSTPERDGRWSCAKHTGTAENSIPPSFQRVGCEKHRYIPIFLDRFATVKQANDAGNWVVYELRPQWGGGTFVNGPRPGLTSAEIRAQPNPAILAHPAIEAVLAQVPTARLT